MLRYGVQNDVRRSGMCLGSFVGIGILTMVAWSAASASGVWLPAAAAQTRRVVPPADEWQFAEQTLREQYAAQIDDARREQRETLAKTWLISAQSQSEPATRYALLMMARQTALEIGSVDLVFQAMDQLYTDFFLDYVTHIAPVAVELPKHVAPQASRTVVLRLEALIRRAVDEDQYQVAM